MPARSLRAMVSLALLSTSVAVLVAAAAPGASAATTTGYDISYPQCNGTFPIGGSFQIVGVNGGRLFTANPCLGTGDGPSELGWAGMNAGFYANTGDPGPALSSHWPNGQASPQPCNTTANPGADTVQCHYDYGWNGAADSYGDAVTAYVELGWAGLGATRTPVANQWWLDVETANSWTSTPSYNVDALQGAADYLASVGAASVGFYAGSSAWQTITGGSRAFSSYPSWVPGAGTFADAQSKCGTTGATGGAVAVSQYLSGGFDGDARCTVQPTDPRVRHVDADHGRRNRVLGDGRAGLTSRTRPADAHREVQLHRRSVRDQRLRSVELHPDDVSPERRDGDAELLVPGHDRGGDDADRVGLGVHERNPDGAHHPGSPHEHDRLAGRCTGPRRLIGVVRRDRTRPVRQRGVGHPRVVGEPDSGDVLAEPRHPDEIHRDDPGNGDDHGVEWVGHGLGVDHGLEEAPLTGRAHRPVMRRNRRGLSSA